MCRLSDCLSFSSLSFKTLKRYSIKAIFNSLELPKISHLWQLFLTPFVLIKLSMNLLTASARIKQNTFVSSAVQFLVFFLVTSTTSLGGTLG